MPKYIKKTKGHRSERARHHILNDTAAFFNPDGKKEDGKVTLDNRTVVKLPIEIQPDGDKSQSNVTYFE